MRIMFLIVGALTVAATASYAQPANIEAARAALRQANVDYCQAMVTKDAPRLTAMYAGSASIFPPDEAASMGPESIAAFISGFMRLPELNFMNCTPSLVDVSNSGDLGYTLFSYVVSYRGPNGQPVNDNGRDLLGWRKQADGSWKVVIDIWNSDKPAATPPR